MESSPGDPPTQGDTSHFPPLSSSPNDNNTIRVDSTAMEMELNSPNLPVTPSAQLLQPPPPGTIFNLDFSSDPITGTSPTARTNLFSASNISPLGPIIRKRNNATDKYPSKTQRTTNQEPKTVQEAIASARELVIKASLLAKAYGEQSKLLDLLEVFREFTETGKVQSTSKVVASQVASLDISTKKLEARARQLAKPAQNQPQPSQIQQTQTLQKSTPTLATIASQATQQEWNLVTRKAQNPTQPKPKPVNRASQRLVLIQSTNSNFSYSPLLIRNQLNSAFLAKGIEGPVIASVTQSLRNKNVVLTTTPTFTADFLVEKRSIWESIIPHSRFQKDQPWYKVIVHGIPTLDFNCPEGMDMIVDEIKTFNQGFDPIGKPYWMSSASTRATKRSGSVAIAFATEEEASKAIRNRLYIAGISVRVEKLYSVAPTTQCQICQGFGHLDTYCRKDPTCRLCAGSHSTKQHRCNTCQATTSCEHLEPKCSNCRGTHPANSKACEVLIAIAKPATTGARPTVLFPQGSHFNL